jgi:hypothetical protein
MQFLWCKYDKDDMAKNGPVMKVAVRSIRTSQKALTRKWSFLAVFALIFLTSYSSLVALDLVPNAPKAIAQAKPVILTASAVEATATPELPTKIEIPVIKVSVSVSNPEKADIQVLDDALLKGAVRYPSSSKLGVAGNVILFGHSSSLRRNPEPEAR